MTATLRNLKEHNYGLGLFCDGCYRFQQVDVDPLLERYGPDMDLPSIGSRAKCTVCGHRGAKVQVQAHMAAAKDADLSTRKR